MAEGRIKNTELSAIAAAIRSKNGESTIYKPGEMAAAIGAIPTGITPTGTVNITQNGTTDVTQYASADVNVPNSYAAGDEGKVVSNGALVEQTARSSAITQNGTYDTTTNNEVTVNVSGGGSGATILSGTSEPTAAQGSDGDIYLQYTDGREAVLFASKSQYLITDYIYTLNSKIVIDCICRRNNNSYPILFGCQNGAARWVFCYYHSAYQTMYVMGNNAEYSAGNGSAFHGKRVIIQAWNGTVTATDKETSELLYTGTVSQGSTAGMSNTPLWLFQRQGLPSSCSPDVDLYDVKIYEGDTLVRHFVPVFHNNAYGLYEKLGENYFYSATSTPFEGEVIPPDTIINTYLKVNGTWQNLINSDIDDVGGLT